MCMYYNTVCKRILVTDNISTYIIIIISAYFLAAASDKSMHLLTSLYTMFSSVALA